MARRVLSGATLVEMMVVIAIVAVLSGFMVSISSSAYGASASAVGDPLSSALGFAKLRAISTRRYTRVEVESQTATVWQSTQIGVVAPTTWQYCQSFPIPSGATTLPDRSVHFTIDFRPDGTSTDGTLLVTDGANAHPPGVVDRGTGAVYARASW